MPETNGPITTGVSQASDPAVAARELREAIWQPDLGTVIFFCSSQYDLDRLAQELNRQFGDIHLVGCTTAGEITPMGYIDGSITGIGFADPDFVTVSAILPVLDEFSIAASNQLVEKLLSDLDRAAPHRTRESTFAFMMIDGMSRQEERVVSSLFNALGQIPLLGGSAGDDLAFDTTYVFAEGRFHNLSTVLLVFHSDHPFKLFKTEHFRSISERMVVTEADGDRRIVQELNAEPAALEYARVIGLPTEDLNPLVFATHPLVVRVGGEYHVRSVQSVNDDDSLNFFCAIEKGIILTAAESEDIVEDLESFFADLRGELGELQVVIGCDCMLRRLEMERKQVKQTISEILLANRVVGFSTYGEQYNAMHVNQTFTGLAIGGADSA